MRRRGIVLELEQRHAIVLTPDGEFTSLPRTGDMIVGAEVQWVDFPAADKEQGYSTRSRRHRRHRWYQAGVAGLAACVAIAAGVWFGNGWFSTQAEAYALVSIDINPSFSMQLNRQYVVLQAVGLNADGDKVLAQVSINGAPLNQAIQEIVDEAVQDGMLPQGDAILVSTAPATSTDSVNVSTVSQTVEQSIQTAVAKNKTAREQQPKVYAISLSHAVWHAADSAKISPGKLAAYLIASKEGMSVSLSQLTGQTLDTILSGQTAKSVAEILGVSDPRQVEQLVQELNDSETSATIPPVTNTSSSGTGNSSKPGSQSGTNQSTQSGSSDKQGDGHSKNSNASANHGSGNASNNGKKEHKGGNQNGTVQVKIGNTVITVPLGSSQDEVDNPANPLTGTNTPGNGHHHEKHQQGDNGNGNHRNEQQYGNGSSNQGSGWMNWSTGNNAESD